MGCDGSIGSFGGLEARLPPTIGLTFVSTLLDLADKGIFDFELTDFLSMVLISSSVSSDEFRSEGEP